MYKVLIGFNVKMAHGEKLVKGAGRVLEVGMPGGGQWSEARFEPGETVAKLPKLADVEFLINCGAIQATSAQPSIISRPEAPGGEA